MPIFLFLFHTAKYQLLCTQQSVNNASMIKAAFSLDILSASTASSKSSLPPHETHNIFSLTATSSLHWKIFPHLIHSHFFISSHPLSFVVVYKVTLCSARITIFVYQKPVLQAYYIAFSNHLQ